MKVCVQIPDPMLGRALADLLRTHGHEVSTVGRCPPDCRLQIASGESAGTDGREHAVLVLQRGSEPPADPEPRAALIDALEARGKAVWRAPLDTGLLLEVLDERGGGARRAGLEADSTAPDLADAPHAWMVFDSDAVRLISCSKLARSLLDLPDDFDGLTIEDLPFPDGLREHLHEDSEGLRSEGLAGRGHLAAWWTDRRGRRVLCLLEAVPVNTPAARHRQWLAELGRMAATLAHEIRNPVASLAGALDLLETESDPDDRAEVLAMARVRLKQMSRLLDKTLSLSRPITDDAEAVDVRAALDSALNTLALDPSMQDVELDYDLPDEPVAVSAYGAPLVQALTNLLLNAAQAQEGRGRIRVSLETEGQRAILRIHDEGPGIPPEKRDAVFEPFYTSRPTGTGLGLAEVRRAMGAMGGSVRLEEVERGACFRLELPLARDE